MLRKIICAGLLLFSVGAASAQQTCLTVSGATHVASDPFPTTGVQPTSCSVYKGGSVIATGLVVLANTLPSSNAGTCAPPSPTYPAGGIGAVACSVSIPAQPVGSVTLTMTASASGVEGPQSAPFTFTSASVFSPPPAPTNLRVIP